MGDARRDNVEGNVKWFHIDDMVPTPGQPGTQVDGEMNTDRIKARETLQHAYLTLNTYIENNISWPKTHNHADKETYDAKMKELENLCLSIMPKKKLYAPAEGAEDEIPSTSGKKQEAIPKAISDLWIKCWSSEPSERPSAKELVCILTNEHIKEFEFGRIYTDVKGNQHIG